ncbi:MAG: NUDIX hydrolase [Acidobacteria bacterium]|nr:NUDIX hydrolase [Acidobacteriota bacterium]
MNPPNPPHVHRESWRFCPSCGGPLVPRRLKAGEPERPVCDRCGRVIYLDPKVAVGTVITNGEGEIALVRRSIEPGYGKWVFPGGYVDRGEEPQVAAVREAREEAGLEIRLDGLIDIYAYAGATPIVIVYAAAAIGGLLEAADESLEAAWYGPHAIPWDELAFPSTRDALRDHRRGRPYTGPRQGWVP